MPTEAKNKFNQRFQFTDDDLQPYANYDYIAYFEDGTSKLGTTDQEGYTESFYTATEQEISIHLVMDKEKEIS
ncbi:hypothetical protein [Entomomonas asaccharolytica]|uniref:Uncharacterized protein n=1 Tax=Entomomonas asaccharolytica TaxID=2785331 RepID=A0A974NDL0_9GAMM|nr:hypothetical protein [Entomomonas asaccharolytica]QQP84640.1 hypothetical protein JHT90_09485 [Entomomonas asaccharolytica]